MRVRWTTDAADDLERVCDYIAEDRPESAGRVAQSVIERIGTLETFPHLGRPGRVDGTREIAFPPLPFIAIYEVLENEGAPHSAWRATVAPALVAGGKASGTSGMLAFSSSVFVSFR